MGDKTIVCPRCGSNQVLVSEISSYWINTGEFFCHTYKTHDSDAPCSCMDCGWEGQRSDIDKEAE